ncbi:protein Mis18-alpha [Anomaloglossus baeobatrachus]|uniref:protein Mis18-alpha n=1 Tax=Anomaloglossus baeobatrachus TaxID=238106 RepID=UPI003F50A746
MAGRRTFSVTDFQRQEESQTLYVCKQCRVPIGDSSDWDDTYMRGNDVMLKAVTPFVERRTQKISNSRCEAGSRYETLSCSNCKTVLGRFYLSTPECKKYKRNLFSINNCQITEYTFGEHLQHFVPESEAPITVEMCQVYKEEIEKQKFLLEMLQERLSRLENKLPCEEELQLSD